MPPKRTRTRSCSGPSGSVGTSSTRRSFAAWMTRASIVRPLKRRRHAAVDVEDVAVDEIRGIAREEHGGPDQVLDVAPAPRRRAVDEPRAELGVVHQRRGEFGLEIAWPEAVHLQT